MFRLWREQSTLSAKLKRTPFRVYSVYELLRRYELLFRPFHCVFLHKVANEGRRGVLRGPPMIKSIRIMKELLVKLVKNLGYLFVRE